MGFVETAVLHVLDHPAGRSPALRYLQGCRWLRVGGIEPIPADVSPEVREVLAWAAASTGLLSTRWLWKLAGRACDTSRLVGQSRTRLRLFCLLQRAVSGPTACEGKPLSTPVGEPTAGCRYLPW